MHSNADPTNAHSGEIEHVKIQASLKDFIVPQRDVYISIKLFIERNGVYEICPPIDQKRRSNSGNDTPVCFSVNFSFVVNQNLKFTVVAYSSSQGEQILCEIHTRIGKILGSRGQTATLEIPASNSHRYSPGAKLFVKAEKIECSTQIVKMQIRASGLPVKKKLFGKSPLDVMFRLHRHEVREEYQEIFESEVLKSEAPWWQEVAISLRKLCEGEKTKKIKIQVLQVMKNATKVLGEAYFIVSELILSKDIDYNANIVCPNTGLIRGKLIICNFELLDKPHFLNYIQAGLKFKLLLGIDYTISNGDSNTVESLHSVKQEGSNEYEKAIKDVFEVLLDYNRNGEVKMFGFGGIPKDSSSISHCFPLMNSANKSCASDLKGVLDIYRTSLKHTQLASPSYLELICNKGKEMAKHAKETSANQYVVLVIFTDGKCHDMQDVISTLSESDNLPLSILIVGLGNGDFSKMKILNDIKTSSGKPEDFEKQRTLVQFVHIPKLHHDPQLLARDILKKLPEHVIEYMLNNEIMPSEIETADRYDTYIEEDLCHEEKNSNVTGFNCSMINPDKAFFKSFSSPRNFLSMSLDVTSPENKNKVIPNCVKDCRKAAKSQREPLEGSTLSFSHRPSTVRSFNQEVDLN